jgi:branched-chain amino acid transport system ATP-binding protein
MLEVVGLSAGYGDVVALREVALAVRDGEFVGVVGANAAGKSTLARAITGLVAPWSGEIRWEGRPINAVPAHRRPELGLAMVPEGRALFGFMTVRENLELGATNPRARERISTNLEQMFELFPILRERAEVPARSLSGGQQQMVALARALMAEPRLLILDEPSVGLAPKIVGEIYDLLHKIFQGRTSILLIEQDVRRCLRAVQRAYVMAQGRVVLEGSAEELANSDEVRRAYLGL